jgi:hypothetical protein
MLTVCLKAYADTESSRLQKQEQRQRRRTGVSVQHEHSRPQDQKRATHFCKLTLRTLLLEHGDLALVVGGAAAGAAGGADYG